MTPALFGALVGLVAIGGGLAVAFVARRMLQRRMALDPSFKGKLQMMILAINAATEDHPALFWTIGSVCWASAIAAVFLIFWD
jgi:hypothetical protein